MLITINSTCFMELSIMSCNGPVIEAGKSDFSQSATSVYYFLIFDFKG